MKVVASCGTLIKFSHINNLIRVKRKVCVCVCGGGREATGTCSSSLWTEVTETCEVKAVPVVACILTSYNLYCRY